MKKILFLVFLTLCSLLISCGRAKQEINDPIAQINVLANMKDSDVKTLASMLGTSEPNLKSILCGESTPTNAVEERGRELYQFALKNGFSFKRLRAAYDPDFMWFDHILQSPTVHPWWFWIITGILAWFAIFRNITLSMIRRSHVIYSDGLYLGVAKLSKYGLVIEGLVFLIAFLFSTILK